MAVMTAQYWGARKLEPIRRVLAIALTAAIGGCALFFSVAVFVPEGALQLLTSDAGAIREGAAYLRLAAYSYPFFTLSMILLAAQRSVENVGVGIAASFSGLLVNILLSWLLIFGRLGFPALGARGAAIATIVARAVECGVVVYYTYRMDHKLALTPKCFKRLDRALIKDFRRFGTPVVMANASWGLAMLIQTAVLGHMGSNAIAANAIANSLFQVISVVAYGTSSASGVLVGKVVGSGNMCKLREYVKTLQWLYLGVGILSSALLFACKDWILRLYAVTPEAMGMAGDFILVLCVTVISTAYENPVLTGIVRGGGDTRFVFFNDLVFMWGIVLPMSILAAFVFQWDPVAVFCCLKGDQILKSFVAVVKVNRYRWVKRVAWEEEPSGEPDAL